MSDCDQRHTDIERCRREVAAIEPKIRSGNPDLDGLCLALADWSGEMRLLGASRELATVAPRLAHVRSRGDGLVYRPRLPRRGQESRPEAKRPATAVQGGPGKEGSA
jgi:hypothetical protein